jgi:HlyD family secretion protein
VDINTNRATSLSVPIQAVTTREQKKKVDKTANPNRDTTTTKPAFAAPEKEYVFVYKAGKVKQTLVTTGIQDDSYIQIFSGLKPGDEVVSAPFSAITKDLKDGMAVQKVDKNKLFSVTGN